MKNFPHDAWRRMVAHGVTVVHFSFEGGGDDGTSNVWFTMADGRENVSDIGDEPLYEEVDTWFNEALQTDGNGASTSCSATLDLRTGKSSYECHEERMVRVDHGKRTLEMPEGMPRLRRAKVAGTPARG